MVGTTDASEPNSLFSNTTPPKDEYAGERWRSRIASPSGVMGRSEGGASSMAILA